MGAQAHDLASKVLPMRGRHQEEAEERAARMAHNLCVIKEAGAAKAAGPQPDGEGYGLDELNEAGWTRPVASDEEQGEESNADALAFLDAVNAV
jgi:hypothetical protein